MSKQAEVMTRIFRLLNSVQEGAVWVENAEAIGVEGDLVTGHLYGLGFCVNYRGHLSGRLILNVVAQVLIEEGVEVYMRQGDTNAESYFVKNRIIEGEWHELYVNYGICGGDGLSCGVFADYMSSGQVEEKEGAYRLCQQWMGRDYGSVPLERAVPQLPEEDERLYLRKFESWGA